MKYADQTAVRAGDKVFGITTPKGLRPSVIAGRVEALNEATGRIQVLPEICGPVWMDAAQCAPALLPVPQGAAAPVPTPEVLPEPAPAPAAEAPTESETKG